MRDDVAGYLARLGRPDPADIFSVVVPAAGRAPLWRRVTDTHDAWLASR